MCEPRAVRVSHQCVLLPQEILYSSGDQWTSSAEIHETAKFVNLALAWNEQCCDVFIDKFLANGAVLADSNASGLNLPKLLIVNDCMTAPKPCATADIASALLDLASAGSIA